MEDQFSYDVFLSHNSADKARVRKLAGQLRKAGLRVWFDEWVIKPGDDIYLTIEQGIGATRVLVLCMSTAALGSQWVALERSTVLFRDPTNSARRFIPLLLDDCELPDTLSRYKYVDFRRATSVAINELLVACLPASVDSHHIEPGMTSERVGKKFIGPRVSSSSKGRGREGEGKASKGEPTDQLAVLERKRGDSGSWIRAVAFSPNGNWVASGSHDGAIRIWDLQTSQHRATLKGHSDVVRCLAFTPDGKRLLSGSDDCHVRIWDTASGKTLHICTSHTMNVSSVGVIGDTIGYSTGWDDSIKLWDLKSGSLAREFETYGDPDINFAGFTPNGKIALVGDTLGNLHKFDVSVMASVQLQNGHSARVNSVQIASDGRFAVSGSEDKTVKVWDLRSDSCIGTMEGHQNGFELHAAISFDSSLVATTGFQDKTVRIWARESGVCLRVLTDDSSDFMPTCVAFSHEGSRLVIGTAGGDLYIYRIGGLRPEGLLEVTRRYVNAKVVLLGDGTIGKTSLAHRLIEDRYIVSDRTHGMNVWPIELPLRPDTNLEREVLLWDLAGQEDYRLVHRLFLHETALALLLLDPHKSDPFAGSGDWLKALDSAAITHDPKRIVARLIVFSQVDVGGAKVSNARIAKFAKENGFAAWLMTSAKTGENCSDMVNGGAPSLLKQLIATHIPWENLPWTATPRVLSELKSAVMSMRGIDNIRLLRFSELEQRLRQVLPDGGFGESELRTAVTLLSNHGVVQHLKFGDLVLLRPELLNGYAAAIIRAARAHTDEIGSVSEAAIFDPGFDFAGVSRLKRPDEELFLRAIMQTFLDHSLCIAEDTPQGRQFVFPSQYRREKDIPTAPDAFVSYTFDGEWQTIWATLVVRLWYSQEFEHRELWRNAVEFQSSRGHLLGLIVDNRQGGGNATISLFFDVQTPDELKIIFIEYVHRHLVRHACNVVRDRRYVCGNCATPVTDLDVLRRRLAIGKDFIVCQNCDERVLLVDLIEQRLKSGPIAREILRMEENATRQLDSQSMEQVLIGHVQAITGEAGQIFREVTKFDCGIDGELEFKDDEGRPSGKKVYVQLKHGNSYLRTRKGDAKDIFDVTNERHLDYWLSQPVDVYLVVRTTDVRVGVSTIRWMNVTRYLQARRDNTCRQIVFHGEELNMKAVWNLRDSFFPAASGKARKRGL